MKESQENENKIEREKDIEEENSSFFIIFSIDSID
jgi:hypothetical protein